MIADLRERILHDQPRAMYRNMVIYRGDNAVMASVETSGPAEAWPKIFNEMAQRFCERPPPIALQWRRPRSKLSGAR